MRVNQTACFTGHRNLNLAELGEIKASTKLVIENLIKNGVVTFLNGGARGFDLLSASLVLELKEQYPHIRLDMVLPCKEQTKGWSSADIALYNHILDNADDIEILSDEYYDRCMLDRNDYLVANSAYCITYLNNLRGGTAYTVKSAKASGLKIYNVAKAL